MNFLGELGCTLREHVVVNRCPQHQQSNKTGYDAEKENRVISDCHAERFVELCEYHMNVKLKMCEFCNTKSQKYSISNSQHDYECIVLP